MGRLRRSARRHPHTKLAYTWYGSWSTLYSLFNDALLCCHLFESDSYGVSAESGPGRAVRVRNGGAVLSLPPSQVHIGHRRGKSSPSPSSSSSLRKGFVPENIYTLQSEWYPQVIQRYGLPLDNHHLYTKSDWEIFAAAVSSDKTRELILDKMALWAICSSAGRGRSFCVLGAKKGVRRECADWARVFERRVLG